MPAPNIILALDSLIDEFYPCNTYPSLSSNHFQPPPKSAVTQTMERELAQIPLTADPVEAVANIIHQLRHLTWTEVDFRLWGIFLADFQFLLNRFQPNLQTKLNPYIAAAIQSQLAKKVKDESDLTYYLQHLKSRLSPAAKQDIANFCIVELQKFVQKRSPTADNSYLKRLKIACELHEYINDVNFYTIVVKALNKKIKHKFQHDLLGLIECLAKIINRLDKATHLDTTLTNIQTRISENNTSAQVATAYLNCINNLKSFDGNDNKPFLFSMNIAGIIRFALPTMPELTKLITRFENNLSTWVLQEITSELLAQNRFNQLAEIVSVLSITQRTAICTKYFETITKQDNLSTITTNSAAIKILMHGGFSFNLLTMLDGYLNISINSPLYNENTVRAFAECLNNLSSVALVNYIGKLCTHSHKLIDTLYKDVFCEFVANNLNLVPADKLKIVLEGIYKNFINRTSVNTSFINSFEKYIRFLKPHSQASILDIIINNYPHYPDICNAYLAPFGKLLNSTQATLMAVTIRRKIGRAKRDNLASYFAALAACLHNATLNSHAAAIEPVSNYLSYFDVNDTNPNANFAATSIEIINLSNIVSDKINFNESVTDSYLELLSKSQSAHNKYLSAEIYIALSKLQNNALKSNVLEQAFKDLKNPEFTDLALNLIIKIYNIVVNVDRTALTIRLIEACLNSKELCNLIFPQLDTLIEQQSMAEREKVCEYLLESLVKYDNHAVYSEVIKQFMAIYVKHVRYGESKLLLAVLQLRNISDIKLLFLDTFAKTPIESMDMVDDVASSAQPERTDTSLRMM